MVRVDSPHSGSGANYCGNRVLVDPERFEVRRRRLKQQLAARREAHIDQLAALRESFARGPVSMPANTPVVGRGQFEVAPAETYSGISTVRTRVRPAR